MTPPLHLLNGDQLAHQLQGASYFQTHLVFREALIVGPVKSTSLDAFWKIRTEFIAASYGATAEEYAQKTVSEIERLPALPEDAEICLWFEDDLFCQVNLWFMLSVIADKPKLKLFRVFHLFQLPKIDGLDLARLIWVRLQIAIRHGSH